MVGYFSFSNIKSRLRNGCDMCRCATGAAEFLIHSYGDSEIISVFPIFLPTFAPYNPYILGCVFESTDNPNCMATMTRLPPLVLHEGCYCCQEGQSSKLMIKTLLLAAWLIPDPAARSLANLVSARSLHFFSQSKLSPGCCGDGNKAVIF